MENVHTWLDETYPFWKKRGCGNYHLVERHNREALEEKFGLDSNEYNTGVLHVLCDLIYKFGISIIPNDYYEIQTIILKELYKTLRINVWCAETSYSPKEWKKEKQGDGQCYVTALLIKKIIGGSVIRAEHEEGVHYFNLLPEGRYVDLTRIDLKVDDYLIKNCRTRNRLNWSNTRFQLLYENFKKVQKWI